MRTDGYVSLWISDEHDIAKLQTALEVTYTDDGDWIAPPFARAFGITYFDDAVREAEVLESPTSSVRAALSGFSYDSTIAERFAAATGEHLPKVATSIILLYDFRFSGSPQVASISDSTWTYIGCVPYR